MVKKFYVVLMVGFMLFSVVNVMLVCFNMFFGD